MTTETDSWHYPRPELVRTYMDAFAAGFTSARGIFARRRMGKTQFLRYDLMPAAQAAGYLTAYTNLWDNIEQPGQALATAILQAVQPKGLAKFWDELNAPVSKLKGAGKVAGIEGSLEVDLAARERIAAPAIQAALQAADRKRKTLLLLIDEAQVLADPTHTPVAKALRAGLDIRKPGVKVLFTGSSESALREMFTRAAAPFYNWAPIDPFPPLDEAFVRALVDHVAEIARKPLALKAALDAFEALNRTPEFFRWYLERYVLHQAEGAAAALEHTRLRVADETGHARAWAQMPRTDRAILMLLGQGTSELLSSATEKKLQAMLEEPDLTVNAARVSLRRLSSGHNPVLARVSHGVYRFEDPEFEEWVKGKRSVDAG